jgi:serine protease AprX
VLLMSRTRPLLAALAAAGLVGAPALVAAPASAAPAPLGKFIVALDGQATPELLGALERAGVVRGFELRSISAIAITAPTDVVPVLSGIPGVRAVAPQRRLQLDLYRSKRQIKADNVDGPDRYTVGGKTYERPAVTGKGTTIGIIDSGIFSPHPGFGDRVVKGLNFEFSELVDSGIVPAEQWDSYAESTGDAALQDELGHGTHVAGTAAGDGSGAQSDRDLAGVAPEANLVSLKIASAFNGLADDVGFEENAMAAIDYLIRHPELGVKVTNNSWGLLETEPSTVPGEETDFKAANEMVAKASAAGITMVFSAGNDGPAPGSINLDPGGHPSAITVAAACKGTGPNEGGSCPAGEITDFSSRGAANGTGPQVDVAAPGDQILAPVSPSVLAPLTECADPSEPLYYCISGTSMAAPHVAGVVALMQQVDPKLTPAQAEHCLETTAVDMLAKGFDIHSGYGMVDTVQALRCAHGLTARTAIGAPVPVDVVPDQAPGTPESPTGGGLAATGSGAGLGIAGLATLAVAALAARRRRLPG